MPTVDEILSRWLPHYTQRQFAAEVRALSTHGEKWLYRPGQPAQLWQGDVLPDLPFLSVGSNEEVSVAVSWGLIISNTCDLVIGQDEYAVIVPIISFAEHLQANPMAEKTLTSFHQSLRENIVSRYFYLPASGRLPESFADFSRPTAIELPVLYERLAATALTDHLSLSLKGHLLLLMKLAYHVARPETPDVTRAADS